jgi:hypothetical protein
MGQAGQRDTYRCPASCPAFGGALVLSHLCPVLPQRGGRGPVIRVGGLTYWEIKCRALNGKRAKLTAEQLAFVGFVLEPEHHEDRDPGTGWLQAAASNDLEDQLQELARLRDVMPGWLALARRMHEEDGGTK